MTADVYFDSRRLNADTIQSWFELLAPEVGKDTFCQRLTQIAQSVARDHIKPALNEECDTRYDEQGWEYLLWTIGLVCAAWTLEIFRAKTRDGHCHTHKKQANLPCPRGTRFHAQLHHNTLASFERLIDVAKSMSVTLVEQ